MLPACWDFFKREKSLNPFPGKDGTLKNFENLMGCLFFGDILNYRWKS
jgi:hypothetical protein